MNFQFGKASLECRNGLEPFVVEVIRGHIMMWLIWVEVFLSQGLRPVQFNQDSYNMR